MLRSQTIIPFTFRLATLLLFVVRIAAGAPPLGANSLSRIIENNNSSTSGSPSIINYDWNVNDKEAPLIGFVEERIKPGLEHSLAYRMDQFRFPIFETLNYDEERGVYLLPLRASSGPGTHFIEFSATDVKSTYVSTDGSNIRLIDNDSMKTIRTSDGARYIFVRYPDGEFRCASIKDASGTSLNLLYTANGLMLHGIVDATGRNVTFNYDSAGLTSVTQTWMAHSEGFTKTWNVGEAPKPIDPQVKYAHVIALKALPANALVRQYTTAMAASDRLLAQIFGGPSAVAGGNGFEPAGLAAVYPFYRGDIIGDDGVERQGHLSYAIHLYGNANGTGDSPLYVPPGFTQHRAQPTPTDAAITFYYPKLGNMSDVTLAVFHVSGFQIINEGDRVRIGNLGGPGGSSPLYKHSHIEFYRGNTGLPSLARRASLRIDPGKILQNPDVIR